MPKIIERFGKTKIAIVVVLIIGLIGTVYVVTHITQLFSKASNPAIVVKDVNDSPLPETSGIPTTTSSEVRLDLTSPLGPPKQ